MCFFMSVQLQVQLIFLRLICLSKVYPGLSCLKACATTGERATAKSMTSVFLKFLKCPVTWLSRELTDYRGLSKQGKLEGDR